MDRVLIQHSERLFVLSAEESPDETLLLDYGAVELLMTELRNKFHYVVVDVPRSPNACTQQVLQSATDLLLVTDLSLAGMRDTMRITGMLPTTNASCNTTLVVNRVGEHKQGEMPRAEFEKGVGRKLDLMLPFDAKTVAAATNFGQPVASGKGPVAAGLREITERLCGPPAGAAAARAGRLAEAAQENLRARHVRSSSTGGGACPPGSPPPRGRPPPASARPRQPPPPPPAAGARARRRPTPSNQAANEKRAAAAKAVFGRIQMGLLERIDASAAAKLSREELQRQIAELIAEIVAEEKLSVTSREQQELTVTLVDDMVGFGPLEPLLADETVNDIMVNGPQQVYVERKGKLELTDIRFRDNAHVMNIAQRIVTRIGRRVDETCPIADARLPDGSRVNIIAPPLAIDGCSISIRKFSKKSITLDVMIRQRNMAENLGKVLKIAAACRLNVVISGGTGSGKTTMLNAMSHLIDPAERVVTIEDAAELQLQQPHVVRLETRPPNLEGTGEITMRDLVKNALRMRPDRIICGEVRGPEALDMLQAMNTGHDGSMCTLHANNPREALTRMENMIGMASVNLPSKAVRTQITGAVNLIVQIQRMRDGVRRVTHVTEVIGMEGEVITTQDLFTFDFQGENRDGTLIGPVQVERRAAALRQARGLFRPRSRAPAGDDDMNALLQQIARDPNLLSAVVFGGSLLVVGLVAVAVADPVPEGRAAPAPPPRAPAGRAARHARRRAASRPRSRASGATRRDSSIASVDKLIKRLLPNVGILRHAPRAQRLAAQGRRLPADLPRPRRRRPRLAMAFASGLSPLDQRLPRPRARHRPAEPDPAAPDRPADQEVRDAAARGPRPDRPRHPVRSAGDRGAQDHRRRDRGSGRRSSSARSPIR